ncbi:TIGR04086 family membrane protein [Desulfoscipio geothermicus]|uniref:Putative membrane protein, TIGR04086 family n=1 Tax=Desulfoscipio geothermicus DSM 3669 TaxID=1121426 RepID=A0A1I6DRQ5_9FIRM|nr:TIGR04086 family membrane protein [Desulfoscipio geothermicus]SFR08119.1 putative membrane protein, TIGR04086 family [Desulfoscipio geothermicus DSM 3669]
MFRGITLVSWSHRDGQAGLFKMGALWGGVLWALTSTLFVCAALMLWVFMTGGQVYHFSGIVTAGILLGTFTGGAVSGKIAGRMGWLHGAAVGLLYCLAIVLFLAVWSTGFPTLPVLVARFFMVLVLAAAGGIIGVNLPAFKSGRGNYKPGLR